MDSFKKIKDGYSKFNKDKYDVGSASFDNVKICGNQLNKIVIGYFVSENFEKTITALFNRGSSVHYVINVDGKQYQLHNELMKTLFAGRGFVDNELVNETGISIMFVNDTKSPYSDEQIDAGINLIKELKEKYEIKYVLGMNEANPAQPYSPGVYFPWEKLAENGVSKFYEIPLSLSAECLELSADKIGEFQDKLNKFGYPVEKTSVLDELTSKFALALNIRYMHENVTCVSEKTLFVTEQLIAPISINSEENVIIGGEVENTEF